MRPAGEGLHVSRQAWSTLHDPWNKACGAAREGVFGVPWWVPPHLSAIL